MCHKRDAFLTSNAGMIKRGWTTSHWCKRQGSSLFNRSVHIDDAGVIIISIISSLVDALNGDKRRELINAIILSNIRDNTDKDRSLERRLALPDTTCVYGNISKIE